MTTGQTISIISAVIVSAVLVSASVIMNTPKEIVPSGDQGNIKDGVPAKRTETRKWNLKQIIETL